MPNLPFCNVCAEFGAVVTQPNGIILNQNGGSTGVTCQEAEERGENGQLNGRMCLIAQQGNVNCGCAVITPEPTGQPTPAPTPGEFFTWC